MSKYEVKGRTIYKDGKMFRQTSPDTTIIVVGNGGSVDLTFPENNLILLDCKLDAQSIETGGNVSIDKIESDILNIKTASYFQAEHINCDEINTTCKIYDSKISCETINFTKKR